jgi:hypothetical protein
MELIKVFENDHWGLIDILRAADKRIGIRRLNELTNTYNNKAAFKIIETRLSQKIKPVAS